MSQILHIIAMMSDFVFDQPRISYVSDVSSRISLLAIPNCLG